MTLRVRHCGWRRARNGVFVCVALAGCAGSASTGAKIAVMPTTGLADRARTILVTGVRPTQRVTVNARSIGADAIWSATASFRASQRGVINLADSAPTSGSYRGVSEMGLFWSQHRVSSKPDASGPFSRSWYTTQTELTVSTGAQHLASARVTQSLVGENVELHVERLASTGFVGVYFTPAPGRDRRPATVVGRGSEGGLAQPRGRRCLPLTASRRSRSPTSGSPDCRRICRESPLRLWPFRPWSSWRPI
jgi:hypothetical protein